MKKSCPQGDSDSGPSAYEANSKNDVPLDQISIEHLKDDRVLPECAIKIYLYRVPRGRCRKNALSCIKFYQLFTVRKRLITC